LAQLVAAHPSFRVLYKELRAAFLKLFYFVPIWPANWDIFKKANETLKAQHGGAYYDKVMADSRSTAGSTQGGLTDREADGFLRDAIKTSCPQNYRCWEGHRMSAWGARDSWNAMNRAAERLHLKRRRSLQPVQRYFDDAPRF